ncbi:hypothetical protein [Streptomyces sp. NPDC088847]|uniref:hypothetical protein n=1 Tax=Streptomyces sp. NPDC088847 TaxID=3365909 RepID=UPI0037F3F6B8
MLISEVIRLLEERRSEVGDLVVEVHPYSDPSTFPVAVAEVHRDRDGTPYVLLDA